jgi:hypothetical protein
MTIIILEAKEKECRREALDRCALYPFTCPVLYDTTPRGFSNLG